MVRFCRLLAGMLRNPNKTAQMGGRGPARSTTSPETNLNYRSTLALVKACSEIVTTPVRLDFPGKSCTKVSTLL